MDGNSYRTHGNGREQAGMLREGRRTMEKVLKNTVRDISGKRDWRPGWDQSPVGTRRPTTNVRCCSLDQKVAKTQKTTQAASLVASRCPLPC